jgi:DNA-binding SARP family transcriptional activator
MTACNRGPLLRTLGHPLLTGPAGTPVPGLRRKDLALLAYLCVEGPRPHSRARLAALLWGESPEKQARHSLTQALGRVQRAAGSGAVVVDRESVRSTGALACDAVWLLEGGEGLDELLALYDGPFLEGFEAGFGSEEFGEWADGRRAELRNAAVRWLEGTGAAAEVAGDWALALRIGERGTQIDPVHEEAHRRVMRALLETGERNLALRHYQDFVRWLADEVGGEPDPDTQKLATRIRDATAASAPPPQLPPPPTTTTVSPGSAADEPPAEAPAPKTPAESPAPETPAPESESPAGAGAAGDAAGGDDDDPPPTPRASPLRAAGRSRFVSEWLLAAALAVLLVCVAGTALFGLPGREPELLPAHGESIRAEEGGPVYLAYAETLWRYPDAPTLDRCLGGWPQRVRRVRRLPRWPRRVLPSVATHPWQGGMVPVVADHPEYPTQHVAVGCVLAPVPDPPTFQAIFGKREWSQSYEEADSVLRAGPRTKEAEPFPVRPAGTLIRVDGGGVKWVVYHGGALTATARVLATYCRAPADAISVSAAEYAYYRAPAALPPADPPCRDAGRQPCPATETMVSGDAGQTQKGRGDALLCVSTAPGNSTGR